MRTDVLQSIALSAHTAAFLRSGERVPEMLTSHSAFRTVHALEFRRAGTIHGGLIAESVTPWMRRLAAEGVVMVRPLLSSCPLTGEPADGAWGVLTDGDRGMEIWRPHWRARMAGHDDAQPYRVSYTAERLSRWHLPPVVAINEAFDALSIRVSEAIERLKGSGLSERAFPLMRCLDLQFERAVDFTGAPDLWPTDADPQGRVLGAAGLRVAQVASSASAYAPSALLTEIYGPLWSAAMNAFEAAVPTVSLAQKAA